MLSLLSQVPDVPATAYGLIGAALLALSSLAALVVKWLLARVEAESKAKDDLTQQVIEKVIPAVTESTVVMKETAELLREISAEGRRRGMRDDQ